jgi:hypothetical protein
MKSQDQIEDSKESPERSKDQSGFSLFWVFFSQDSPVAVICFIVLKVAQSTKGSLTIILVTLRNLKKVMI